MSASTMFDTHRHVKELAGHGLSEACAESIVNVVQDGFTHNVATKSDLADLRAGIQEQLTKLDGRAINLEGRVTNIETNMATKTDIANIQRDIERSKNDLTTRIAGLLIAFSGIIGAVFFGALQMSSP